MNIVKEVGFETTPAELLNGDINPTLGEIGLSDCQMEVISSDTEAGREYNVNLDVKPFDEVTFVDFLNTVAPSERRQYHLGIENDWVYATQPGSEIYKMHERLGRPWEEFLPHANSFLDVMRSHYNDYWGFGVSDIEKHTEWEASLPFPVPFDNSRLQGAAAMDTTALLNLLETAGFKDPGSVLLSLIHQAAKISASRRKGKFRFRQSPEYLQAIESMEKILREPNDHRVLRAFAKLSRSQRRLLQGNMLSILTGDDSMIPEIIEDWGGSTFRVRHALCLDDTKRPSHGYKQVIDRDGRQANVSFEFRSIFEDEVPSDYRDLDAGEITTVTNPFGYYEADALVINTGGGKDRRKSNKTFMDERTVRQTRDVLMSPHISWTDTLRSNGSLRTQWDLELMEFSERSGQMERIVYESGLLGLIAVAGLSSDIPQMGRVWRAERGLPVDKNKPNPDNPQQEMGAAQLPLLALMQKHHIARGNFLQIIREKIASLER